jgi:DNA-binding CsgD family transcriptional regulator
MSHNDSTSNTYFESYFEDRFAPVEAKLSIWGVKAFPGKGDLARDEALQQARIVLWTKYSGEPEDWAAKPAQVWVAFGKQVYEHFILHEKIVERHTDYAENFVQNDSDQTGDEDLSGKLHAQQQRSQYPRDILLADERIDLERGLACGFEQLPERYHADMRLVMRDIMEGYSQVEIRERHGWSNNHTRVLFRHLQTTFYQALTGHKRTPCGYIGSKAPATDDELHQLYELRAQGLSFVKIGARLGYTQGWVMQNLRKAQTHRPTITEREQARNKRIAEVQALVAQGMSYRNIAIELGTSYNTIRRLLGKC